MIERYVRPQMKQIFTDEHRYEAWLKVELAAMQAHAEQGLFPLSLVQDARQHARVDAGRIAELEQETRHDVIAFTRQISETLGPERQWMHYGLTSTDVVDTAYGCLYQEADQLILAGLEAFRMVLREQALRYRETPCIGRTHGIHADITSFGLKWALWYEDMGRQIERFKAAAEDLEIGKISGAVGNFANTDPVIQDRVCDLLGLKSARISTQVLQRDRHAQMVVTLAQIATQIEKIAMEIRHLQRTEVNEVREPFASGQKGSSAMPHKRNPIVSENMCGCARVVRGYLVPAFEDIPLWHERDISHSSAERIIIPDAYQLVDYMLHRYVRVLRDLEVDQQQMLVNIKATHGVIFAQQVMNALIRKGLTREAAYDLVQPLALEAYHTHVSFRSLLNSAPFTDWLSTEALDACFELDYFLRNVPAIYERIGL